MSIKDKKSFLRCPKFLIMINSIFLESALKEFQDYKKMGERALAQIPDDKLNWQYNSETNSGAIIVRHLSGNMLSRWSDFLTSDGEKEWRNRDAEFEGENLSRVELMDKWNAGWLVLFNALTPMLHTPEDLEKIIYIRNQPHTVVQAINRQVAHYAYHVGQIVQIGKMVQGNEWKNLSIPRGQSSNFNSGQFSKPPNG